MEEKKGTLTPLGEIITSLLKDARLPFNPDDARIWKVWNDVVGPAIARHAQPHWIKDGRLRVQVSDPIWLQELGFAADDIKQRLNRKLGRTSVERLEFRLRSQ